MIGAALALGVLIAVPVMLACGIRPRSWQTQVEYATRATWDDLTVGGASADSSSRRLQPVNPVAVELDTPIPTPDLMPVAFPGYLLPSDDREEARRAGS